MNARYLGHVSVFFLYPMSTVGLIIRPKIYAVHFKPKATRGSHGGSGMNKDQADRGPSGVNCGVSQVDGRSVWRTICYVLTYAKKTDAQTKFAFGGTPRLGICGGCTEIFASQGRLSSH
jgi:hypothetical protein